MQLPLEPNDPLLRQHPRRGPVALWPLAAAIGIVLASAALGAAFTTDNRDFAARHGSVPRTHAL